MIDRTLVFALLLALPGTLRGDAIELLPAAPTDLVATRITSAPAVAGGAVARQTVAVSWALAPDAALDLSSPAFEASSREHWFHVAAGELAAGVALEVGSAGAIVRLSPLGDEARGDVAALAVDPRELEIVDAQGVRHRRGEGLARLADEAALDASGVDFPAGTSAFRLRAELGDGPFTLVAPRLAGSSGRFLVHVFEPESAVRLTLATDRPSYLAGERIEVAVALGADSRAFGLVGVDGAIAAPDGRRIPLRFVAAKAGAGWSATAVLPESVASARPGLWSLEVAARGADGARVVRRNARTAFGLAAPTGRLTGEARRRAKDGLGLAFGVEIAAPGRYELRAVLYGRDRAGELRPAAVLDSAAWLEPGRRELELVADRATLDAIALEGPWELGDLRLVDQTRMGLLHRQAHAARLAP